MKIHLLVLGLIAGALTANAGTGFGKYAGEFMSLGVGARPLSMGGAYVALANDVTSGYWNPAGLSHMNFPQVALMHAEQFGSLVNYDYGAVALPFGSNASIGVSVIRLGVDNIPNTISAGIDAFGNPVTDPSQIGGIDPNFARVDPDRVTYFNSADWAFYFTYSKKESDNFSYGANVKLIRRELGDNSATGLGFDLGVWYTPMDDLVLGANLQDVTTTFLAWDTGTNELVSPTMKIGSAYFIDIWGGRIAPAVDFDVRFENRRTASNANLGRISFDIHTGLEFQYKNVVALRMGYNDVKQWSMGAGVQLPKLNIDYSFARFASGEVFPDTHRISIMFTLESAQFARTEE
ncbi:MAG TPA: PorV/PorQ family protein [Bacteroidota bacterium]|jgi:hypothetical protein